MSAKNRGSEVVNNEFYATPDYTIKSLLKELDLSNVSSFHEPCKGDGAILNALPDSITKSYCELTEDTDYLTTKVDTVDLIITNPPFSLAREFIEKSLKESDTVIYLLRLNYLGSSARKKFWNDNPPSHVFVLSNRPKFIAKCPNKKVVDGKRECTNKKSFEITNPPQVCSCGTIVRPASDATEYAWFVWQNNTGIVRRRNGVYSI